MVLCSRFSSLPMDTNRPSQWRSLCGGSKPREIHGFLLHQSVTFHSACSQCGCAPPTPSSSRLCFQTICTISKAKILLGILKVIVKSSLRPRRWAFGAALPGGSGQSCPTATSVRGLDSGLCPGSAPAWRAAPWGCVDGVSSGRLEDCRVSEPGLYLLRVRKIQIQSVSLKIFYGRNKWMTIWSVFSFSVPQRFPWWQAQEKGFPTAKSFDTRKHFSGWAGVSSEIGLSGTRR